MKTTKRTVLALVGLIAQPTAALSGSTFPTGAQFFETGKWRSNIQQVAFIDALFNSLKGEAALKATCKTVWHTSESTTFVEQGQCNNALKEIAFAKENFPAIVSQYEALKGLGVPRTIDNEAAPIIAASYVAAENYIKLCTDKSQVAIRAAKTMDYWGTERVGDWYYKNLYEMGAWKAQDIINSCKNGSLVYQIRDKSQPLLATWWGQLSRSLEKGGSQESKSVCFTNYNKSQWSQSLLSQIATEGREDNSKLETLDKISRSSTLLSRVIEGFSLSRVEEQMRALRKSREACSALYQYGMSTIAENERQEAESKRRAAAAQAEANRRAQIQAEENRRSAEKAAAESAALRRRQQEKQRIIQGVKIQ
jgi:hypothetical protein